MLDALKFVQGAVSRKDFVAALSHFRIEGGKIKSFNGRVALCSPIALDLCISPKAAQFSHAIASCEGQVAISVTATGRLGIRSGAFRAYVECTEEPYPVVEPEGVFMPIDGHKFLAGLRVVAPFIAQDASREWARGVLLRGASMFATNNVIAIEHWFGDEFPASVNIPEAAVDELLRINVPPVAAQFGNGNVTFHYADSRWLKTQLFSTDWPDVSGLLDRTVVTDEALAPIPSGMFTELQRIAKFTDECGRAFVADGRLGTAAEEESGIGAHVAIEGLSGRGVYSLPMLLLLDGVAERADFNAYPRVPFVGDRLRGVVVGMHQ